MRQIVRILKYLFLNIVALALLINGYEPAPAQGTAGSSTSAGAD
ncbi:MAG: hypothetical protein WC443_03535 [Desulfobaccales bacterium]